MQARVIQAGARLFGTRRVIPYLLKGEAKDIQAYARDPEAKDLAREERGHERDLQALAGGSDDPLARVRGEKRHTMAGDGSLRAAVLGLNDGLVSNFSLVMGVAGGTGDASFVVVAGVAGLVAGAFSMAAGEYVSMRSQTDIYEHQIRLERAEMEMWPEEEEEELALVYQAKGLTAEEASLVASRIMRHPDVAIDTKAREELGLDPDELGSPWGAAISSFLAFAAGAVVPLSPYVVGVQQGVVLWSAGLSALALVVVGGVLASMSGRNALWGALRMLLAGGIAAAATYAAGTVVGNAVSL
jgi:VIT1/CCC1 family predicted Fe2+/Mn2+ transporter